MKNWPLEVSQLTLEIKPIYHLISKNIKKKILVLNLSTFKPDKYEQSNDLLATVMRYRLCEAKEK